MRMLLIALLLAGCNKKSAPPPRDLSPSPPSCAAAARCAEGCSGNSLDACVAGCAEGLRDDALDAWRALQGCSKPACAASCIDPGGWACRLCATKNCASQIAACLSR